MTSRDVQRNDSQITADNYSFKAIKKFVHLGSAVTTKIDVSLEIKRRVTLANKCYYGLNRQLSNTLQDANRTRASLWRRGMDAIKHRCTSLESIRVKSLT